MVPWEKPWTGSRGLPLQFLAVAGWSSHTRLLPVPESLAVLEQLSEFTACPQGCVHFSVVSQLPGRLCATPRAVTLGVRLLRPFWEATRVSLPSSF